jgi:putative (di)nucleoside polyphosphate hydrolase
MDRIVIDEQGYRPNVGIIICNDQGQVLWAKRIGQNAFQFPQGGIQAGETPEKAMYRELEEEIGLQRQDVKILGSTRGWLRYRLPKRMVRSGKKPVCVGQKQKWFLLQLVSHEERIDLNRTKSPEFDGWQWVNYWYPLGQVVAFKRDVYRRALAELSSRIARVQRLAS